MDLRPLSNVELYIFQSLTASSFCASKIMERMRSDSYRCFAAGMACVVQASIDLDVGVGAGRAIFGGTKNDGPPPCWGGLGTAIAASLSPFGSFLINTSYSFCIKLDRKLIGSSGFMLLLLHFFISSSINANAYSS